MGLLLSHTHLHGAKLTIVRSLRFSLTALVTPLPSTESLNPPHTPVDFPNIFAKHK